MKRLFWFFAVALVSLCGAGCHSEEKAITETASAYLDAMGNYRFDEAKKFASKATCEVTLHYFETVIMPHVDSSYIQRNTPAQITIGEIYITSDSTATVNYHKSTPITQQNGELQLIKEDGSWKADVVIMIPNTLQWSDSARTIPNIGNLKKGTSPE